MVILAFITVYGLVTSKYLFLLITVLLSLVIYNQKKSEKDKPN